MLDGGGGADSRVESLSWSVRLSDKAPHKRIVVWLAAVTAGVSGVVLFDQALLGFLGFAIILASTAEFWLGVRYTVKEEGASRRCGLSLSSIDWEDVKRVVINGEDIKLSPLPEPTAADPFRGITLTTVPENRDQVIQMVRSHVSDDVRFLG